jgi:hypothetical protein
MLVPSVRDILLGRSVRTRTLLLSVASASVLLLTPSGPNKALAAECGAEIIADLVGTGNVAEISATGQSECENGSTPVSYAQQPFFTYELACSTDRRAAAEGICSTTPCPDFRRFFAFRTIHRPDGSSGPTGFSCVTLEQAVASPGVTLAQVFEAIRKVKLPGGDIGVEPGARGLVNLESYFGSRGLTRRRLICRWVGRRCMRNFGWLSTGGALVRSRW